MFVSVLRNIVTLLQLVIFVHVVLHFLPNIPSHPITDAIHRAAEILNTPARRLFDALGIRRGPLDWTPLFTIFLLNIGEALVLKLLYG